MLQRKQSAIRLTDGQLKRLNDVLEYRGDTSQAFFLRVVLDAIAEVEAEMAARGEQRRRSVARDSKRNAPTGLGISLRQEKSEPESPIGPLAPSVVVNVGGDSKAADEIAILAGLVLSGQPYERDGRKRMVLDMIKSLAKTETEKRDLEKKLEAAIAKRTEEPAGDLVQLKQKFGAAWSAVKGILE